MNTRASTKRAPIGALAALIIGIVATVVVGIVGVAISIKVSRETTVKAELVFDNKNTESQITVKADKGKLYYALENRVPKRTAYEIKYSTSKNGTYSRIWSGNLNYEQLVGKNYICTTSGWTDRYFKVKQQNNLSSRATHADFYAEVR